jgi:hypothetical protein
VGIIGAPKRPAGVTAPAVPASGSPATNTFPHAVFVTLRGGTVTAVAVGGVTLSAFSSTVLVPAGATITLTYAVAPTWTWFGVT